MYTWQQKLKALQYGGVDNWGGYGYALQSLPDDYTDRELLQALEDHGVENWECYGWVMDDLLKEYGGEDLEDEDGEEESETPGVSKEELSAEKTRTAQILRKLNDALHDYDATIEYAKDGDMPVSVNVAGMLEATINKYGLLDVTQDGKKRHLTAEEFCQHTFRTLERDIERKIKAVDKAYDELKNEVGLTKRLKQAFMEVRSYNRSRIKTLRDIADKFSTELYEETHTIRFQGFVIEGYGFDAASQVGVSSAQLNEPLDTHIAVITPDGEYYWDGEPVSEQEYRECVDRADVALDADEIREIIFGKN